MRKNQDAYGAELLAAYRDRDVLVIVEREDNLISTSSWPGRYFSSFASWSRREEQEVRLARGRVLDIGCGAGRFALYLQTRAPGHSHRQLSRCDPSLQDARSKGRPIDVDCGSREVQAC